MTTTSATITTELTEGARAALEIIAESAERGTTLDAVRLGWDYELLGKPGIAVRELVQSGAVVSLGATLYAKEHAQKEAPAKPAPSSRSLSELTNETAESDQPEDETDDTPMDGEPNIEQPAPPATTEVLDMATTTLTCQQCSKSFKGGPRSKWCSEKCRTAAKSSTGGASKKAATPPRPLPQLPPAASAPAVLPSLSEVRAALALVQRFADGIGRILG